MAENINENTVITENVNNTAEIGNINDGIDVAKNGNDSTDASRPVTNSTTATESVNNETTKTKSQLLGYPPDYYLRDDKLFFEKTNEKGKREAFPVSGPILVGGFARDENSNGWGRIVVWKDKDSKLKWVFLPEGDFITQSSNIIKELASKGLMIHSKDILMNFLLRSNPDRKYIITYKTGWHMADGKLVYVFPDTSPLKTLTIYNGASDIYTQKGTVREWKEKVSSLCRGNPIAVFAICASFSGPLLKLFNIEGGGFHIIGNNASGKSISVKYAAASVWGSPDKFALSWKSTGNAYVSNAQLRNDNTFIIDEMGQADANKVEAAIYDIANGREKSRCNINGEAKDVRSWLCMILSTGEKGIMECNAEASKMTMGGTMTRLLQIEAVKNGKAVFDYDLHGFNSGSDLANEVRKNSLAFYGTAGREFIDKLKDARDEANAVYEKCKSEFLEGLYEEYPNLEKSTNSEFSRVFSRFITVATAGELAVKWGICDFSEFEPINTVIEIAVDWIKQRGSLLRQEETRIFEQVTFFMQRNMTNFINISSDADVRRPIKPIGFVEEYKNEQGEIRHNYYVETGIFKQEALKGFRVNTAIRTLVNAGWIRKTRGAPTTVKYAEGINNSTYLLTDLAMEYDISPLIPLSEKQHEDDVF